MFGRKGLDRIVEDGEFSPRSSNTCSQADPFALKMDSGRGGGGSDPTLSKHLDKPVGKKGNSHTSQCFAPV